MNRLTPALALAAAFAVGCTDSPTLTAPPRVPPPRFAFSDGARSGNPNFFFLFPLGHFPRLSPNWDVGKAKTDQNTRVEICRLTSGATPVCEAVIKEFTPEQITVVQAGAYFSDENDEKQFPREPFYRAIWSTAQSNLNPDRFYRIRVLVGDFELGFVDIDPVRTLSQLLRVDRKKYVGLIVGLPFPIRYRVEEGALCDVNTTCVEQFVEAEEGARVGDDPETPTVYLDIPAEALPVDATITVERKAVPPSGVCEPTSAVVLQFEGCFEITSHPDLREHGGFQRDVVVALCIDPRVPERLRANLEIIKWHDGETKRLEDAPAPFLECDDFQPTPPPGSGFIGWAERGLRKFASRVGRIASPRPAYASDGGLGGLLRGATDDVAGDALSTFFWGLPAAISAASEQSQTGVVGQPVGTPPAVRVETAHEHEHDGGEEAPHFHEPVSDAPVTFTVTSGGGQLLDATGAIDGDGAVQVLSDDGEATLPSGWTWVLGPLPGANKIQASGDFEGSPIEFTVTASAAGGFDINTLRSGLDYPKGLWIKNGYIYLTETAGRNTSFGGRNTLLRMLPDSDFVQTLLGNAENTDAVVVDNAGKIYLTSYTGGIPGESGALSVAEFIGDGWNERPLLDLEIAANDMFMDANEVIYIIGSSDAAEANSLYQIVQPDTVNVLATGLGRAWSLTQVGGTMYYSKFAEPQVRYLSEGNFLLIDNATVLSLTSDGTYLYYSEVVYGEASEVLNSWIKRKHLLTGAIETIATLDAEVTAVRYDAATGNLYFLEGGTKEAEYHNGALKVVIGVGTPPIP